LWLGDETPFAIWVCMGPLVWISVFVQQRLGMTIHDTRLSELHRFQVRDGFFFRTNSLFIHAGLDSWTLCLLF